MSKTLPNKTMFQILFQTSTLSIIRGWRADHPGWRTQLGAAALPADLAALISRIVIRTRLWRSERTAVAAELAAHFLDGLDAGLKADDLIQSFGNERAAAKLIRRAKRRNRPLIWHSWLWLNRLLGTIVVIYLLAAVHFVIGRPSPSVDYLARLNEKVPNPPPDDCALPLWHRAAFEMSDVSKDGTRTFPGWLKRHYLKRSWPEIASWLKEHSAGLELARSASRKPTMGLVLKRSDPLSVDPKSGDNAGSYEASLGNLFYQFNITPFDPCRVVQALILDIRFASESEDGNRVEADVVATLGLAKQLQTCNFEIADEAAVASENDAVERLAAVLYDHPRLLRDDQLIRLAHAFRGPQVAGDLVSLRSLKLCVDDLVQRIYTDDLQGNGHITAQGLQLLLHGSPEQTLWDRVELDALKPTFPTLMQSRRELMIDVGIEFDAYESNYSRPMRDTDWLSLAARLNARRLSLPGLIHYAAFAEVMPMPRHQQETAERYLGQRDGMLVGIALELYHRKHGHYPLNLADLTLQLLPQIPADRITGDPLKYRLIDGKPVVYSVGADRIDDGGKPATACDKQRPDGNAAAQWGVSPANAPKGDWILYPPISEADGE